MMLRRQKDWSHVSLLPFPRTGSGEDKSPTSIMGLSLVARVDIQMMLYEVLELEEPFICQQFPAKFVASALVELSQLAMGRPGAGIDRLRHRTMNSLETELLANISTFDPIELGLPACGLVRGPDTPAGFDPDCIMNPITAMVAASRIVGHSFIARRTPSIGNLIDHEGAFWIYSFDTDGDQGRRS